MSYTAPDTVTFDGPGCASIPWTLTWSKPDTRGFDWTLEVRQPGSNSAEDSDYDYQFSWDPGGTATGTLCVGEFGGYDPTRGPLYLGGSIEVKDDKSNVLGTAAFTQTPVSIKRNRSSFKSFLVRSGKPYSSKPPRIRGKVVALTMTKGSMGADGTVTVQARRKGVWRTVGTASPDEFGRFRAELYKRITVTQQVRAVLTECGWCTDTRMVVGAD